MRLARNLLTSAAAAGIIGLCASAALAQSVCAQLEADLVNADRGGAGSPDDFAKYDRAIRQQRDEIQRAMAEARRANCVGGFLFFRTTPQPKCRALMPMIDRMHANLARLESRRDQYAYRPRASAWDKNRILQALAANNCGPQYAAYKRRNSFMSSIFGPGAVNNGGFFPQDDFYPQNDLGYGTYRTLCVRTCDGYYFPISFSTVSSQFARDEQACQAMCPGEEVKLFVHRNPGEDSEAMVSVVGGEPYIQEPYAFAYRNAYDPACTCRFQVAATPIGGFGVAPVEVAVPVPVRRPETGDDPDTVANAFGGFTPGPVSPDSHASVAGLSESREKTVRVVGPSYYYAQ